MRSFASFGYERVQLPAFEYASVVERGLGELDPSSMVRFVEPETGEVVVLRPDMTPQVARLVATKLARAPMPARLCYQGSVLRRRRERARNNQQIPQAGIELIGVPGQAGDLEVVRAALAAVRAAGLSRFVLDLGHSGIAASLLSGVKRGRWAPIVDALAVKDQGTLHMRASALGLAEETLAALVALPELHGGAEIWPRARQLLGKTRAAPAMEELFALTEAISQETGDAQVLVDLGETWSFNYYTGPMFQLLAEGPGLPVGSGGRYDALYEQFGLQHSAAGCAIDLDNLGWALAREAHQEAPVLRVLVQGPPEVREVLLTALRARGLASAPAPESDVLGYAKAWRYSHVVELADNGAQLTDVVRGDNESLPRDARAICERFEKPGAQNER
jgi:ATP phosphoribosyltransferase regulatory subunit